MKAAEERTLEHSEFDIGPMHCADDAAYKHLWELRTMGFSSWYGDMPNWYSLSEHRRLLNARGATFPEFLLTVMERQTGRAVAYLYSLPTYWSGFPESLQTLDYYYRWNEMTRRGGAVLMAAYEGLHRLSPGGRLFQAAVSRFRTKKLHGCNTIMFTAMVIDPAYRGRRIPSVIIDASRQHARQLGYEHIVSPFRPNEYGKFKKERKQPHSAELFSEYCSLKRDDGVPVDAWLRSLVRNGMEILKPEPRSLTLPGTIEGFEALRRSYKPETWYETSPGVWECGDTQTWYTDPSRGTAHSVEPNVWGRIPL